MNMALCYRPKSGCQDEKFSRHRLPAANSERRTIAKRLTAKTEPKNFGNPQIFRIAVEVGLVQKPPLYRGKPGRGEFPGYARRLKCYPYRKFSMKPRMTRMDADEEVPEVTMLRSIQPDRVKP